MDAAKRTDRKAEAFPAERKTIALDRTFSPEEMDVIRRGFLPRQMEDKWFIYWQDGTLFFHRSWTGFCIYVVRISPSGDGSKIEDADLNRNTDQYGGKSDEHDAALISYLIDNLLLHRAAIYPDSGGTDPQDALRAWSDVGRAYITAPAANGVRKRKSPARRWWQFWR
jgi:hypothetical protein